MRLALMIEGQEGVSWADWLALAGACEEHGVEALFRSDHYLSGADPGRAALDAWAVLPALAARTERIELGTLVSPVTFRPAAVLANASMTAHEISGGRVSLGMGAGWMEAEHTAFGFPFPPTTERVRLLAEQVEAVRGFWGDGPRPRLVVGGGGRSGTIDPAARFADEYNTVLATPAECAERRERLARACDFRFVAHTEHASALQAAEPAHTAPHFRTLTHADPHAWLIDWCARFAPPQGASRAIGYAKLAIKTGFHLPLGYAQFIERQLQEPLLSSPDGQHGMQAYMDRQVAEFKGE